MQLPKVWSQINLELDLKFDVMLIKDDTSRFNGIICLKDISSKPNKGVYFVVARQSIVRLVEKGQLMYILSGV